MTCAASSGTKSTRQRSATWAAARHWIHTPLSAPEAPPRANIVQPAAAVGGLAPREPAEMRDLLAPIIRNLWLALRIGGLLYFFNLGGGMHWNWRPVAVLGLMAA